MSAPMAFFCLWSPFYGHNQPAHPLLLWDSDKAMCATFYPIEKILPVPCEYCEYSVFFSLLFLPFALML